jgi:hypothetical protein
MFRKLRFQMIDDKSTLRRVEARQARLDAMSGSTQGSTAAPDFTGLAEDLEAAWNVPGVTMRARQQLVRALITDIADVDEKGREIILTIHWQGGQHSQLRIRKPRTGEHGRRTSEEALAVIRSMSCRWSDQDWNDPSASSRLGSGVSAWQAEAGEAAL